MNKAYNCASPEEAKRRLLDLAESLQDEHPGAASSIREGLDESLTVLRLGVGETLAQTLSSTNNLENLNGTIRHVSRRVKRWSGEMAMRWSASGLLEAEKGFHRVKGYREMAGLIASLEALCPALVKQAAKGRKAVA
jgi:transposase-like protein